jgi:hypothetical protein
VLANEWGYFRNEMHMNEKMIINGHPFFMRNPAQGTWKGYELIYVNHVGSTRKLVLLHRPGELPYIPVTRGQYMEFCIKYLNDYFNEQIKGMTALMPNRSLEEQEAERKKSLDKIDEDYKSNPKNRDIIRKNFLDNHKTDQQKRDETINKIVENKKAAIDRYEKEMEKTRADNQLSSPAVVRGVAPISDNTPIFSTEAENGMMLVTENPVYIKKNLPKNVPQFIVVLWGFNEAGSGQFYRRSFEDDFPIEKLQAMIDK